TKIKTNQTAQRRAANASSIWTPLHAIYGLNKWHQLLQHEFTVAVRTASAEFGHFGRSVFVDAGSSRVVDADDDHRFGAAAHNGCIGAITNVPIHSGHIGSASIKKILAVMQIEDGKVACWLAVVTRRQIHHHVTRVPKVA